MELRAGGEGVQAMKVTIKRWGIYIDHKRHPGLGLGSLVTDGEIPRTWRTAKEAASAARDYRHCKVIRVEVTYQWEPES